MAKTRFLNRCCYGSEDYHIRCNFNIYQAVEGGIFILLGDKRSKLTLQQIEELDINIHTLEYFDYDKFKKSYDIN